jgi:hypothetical protein
MHPAVGYSEAAQLTHLIEQLREELGAEPPPNPRMIEPLEGVLSRLVLRNQQLRLLHRLARLGGSLEHMDAMRGSLEALDAELLQELPGLLERLRCRS